MSGGRPLPADLPAAAEAAGLLRRSATHLVDAVRALREVHDADGYPSWWPDDPEAWLTPTGMERAWVAVEGGEVLGHVCVVGGVDEPVIVEATGGDGSDLLSVSRLFVRPSARGRHLGSRLLDAVRAYAVAEGAQLVLDVVDDDGPAIRLYDRLGWRRVGRRPSDWTTPTGRRYDTVHFLAPAQDG